MLSHARLCICRLTRTLEDRLKMVTDEIKNLELVDKTTDELLNGLKKLQREINLADVWAKDQKATKQNFKVTMPILYRISQCSNNIASYCTH